MKYIYEGLLLATLVVVSGCVCTGVEQCSNGIEESKRRGVFIAEYTPSVQHINEHIYNFEFDKVWAEYQWYYKNQLRQMDVSKDIIVLYITLKTKNESIFYEGRTSKVFGSKDATGIGTCGKNGYRIVAYLEECSDTLTFIFMKDQQIIFTKKGT